MISLRQQYEWVILLILTIVFVTIVNSQPAPTSAPTISDVINAVFGTTAFPLSDWYDNGGLVSVIAKFVIRLWLLIAAAIVFFMQSGFGMLEVGSVQAKNTKNILIKNLLDSALGALTFWLWGYAFAIGGDIDTTPVIGAYFFCLDGLTNYARWFYQFAFAATSATIVSGSMAERTRLGAYVIYTIFITSFVHPLVVHWVWTKSGFLSPFNAGNYIIGNNFIDFAGGAMVHVVGGFAGLAGTLVLGPRNGRFIKRKDGKLDPKWQGHNVVYTALGTFCLWFAWFSYIIGAYFINLQSNTWPSSYIFSKDTDPLNLISNAGVIAGRAAVITAIGSSTGAIVAIIFEYLFCGYTDLKRCMFGLIAGLVSVTGAGPTIEPWSAVIVAAVAGILFVLVSHLLLYLEVDDPLDAFAVHGVCGAWGIIAVGLFAQQNSLAQIYFFPNFKVTDYGLLVGGGGNQLAAQALGLAIIMPWAFILSGILFLLMKWLPRMIPRLFPSDMHNGLRVSFEDEEQGLDYSKHGGSAYPEFSIKKSDDLTYFEVQRLGAKGYKSGKSYWMIILNDQTDTVTLYQLDRAEERTVFRADTIILCDFDRLDQRRLSLLFKEQNDDVMKLIFRSVRECERFFNMLMMLGKPELKGLGHRRWEPSIFIGSWNVGNGQPQSDLSSWIPEGLDLYAIGSQECDYRTDNDLNSADDFIRRIWNSIGNNYVEVGRSVIGEMVLVVFARVEHVQNYVITNVVSESASCGLLFGAVKNKGGGAVSLNIHETTFVFINVHLNAHQSNWERRNLDAALLISSLNMGHTIDIVNQFHVCFFFGDMNYRIDLEWNHCVELVGNRDWNALWDKDQFIREQSAGNVLHGFKTGFHSFPPTYRYKKGVVDDHGHRVYDPANGRIPAWCDRVLWRTLPNYDISQKKLWAADNVISSDHSPIGAVFEVSVTMPFVPMSLTVDTTIFIRLSDLSGSGLRIADATGQSDPYIIFFGRYLEKEVRTSVCRQTLNPVWNEDFELEVGVRDIERLKHEYLFFCLYDYDVLSDDDYLGTGRISLYEACCYAIEGLGGISFICDIVYEGRKHGTLQGSARIEFQTVEGGSNVSLGSKFTGVSQSLMDSSDSKGRSKGHDWRRSDKQRQVATSANNEELDASKDSGNVAIEMT